MSVSLIKVIFNAVNNKRKGIIMKITGNLINAEYFDTSRSGNPRYICVIQNDNDSVIFYTDVDSQHSYSITNHLNDVITVELQYKRNKLTLDSLEGLK